MENQLDKKKKTIMIINKWKIRNQLFDYENK